MSKIIVKGQGECKFDGQFSILECLDEAGFDVPYSCRGGSCGACEVKLVRGEVEYVQEHAYEPQPGHILTCSAIPKSEIVEIELP